MGATQYRWWWVLLVCVCVATCALQASFIDYAITSYTRRYLKLAVEGFTTFALFCSISRLIWIDRALYRKRDAMYGLSVLTTETNIGANGTAPRVERHDQMILKMTAWCILIQLIWSAAWLVPMAESTIRFFVSVLLVEITTRCLTTAVCTMGIVCPWNNVKQQPTPAPPVSLQIDRQVASRTVSPASDPTPVLRRSREPDDSFVLEHI
jgi:hypothetical protein